MQASSHRCESMRFWKQGIGVFCLVWPLILAALGALYVLIHRNITSEFYTLSLIRFVLTFGVLLIPSTLMGGTLPVLTRFFVQRLEQLGGQRRDSVCVEYVRRGYRMCRNRLFPA